MQSLWRFVRTHKTLFISVGFLTIFAFTVARATPPTSPYSAGSTLDPQCAPGDTNCTVVTNAFGDITASTLNKITFTAPTNGSTLTLADGKTLTINNTLAFSGTDGSTLNIGTGGTLGTAAFTAASAYEVPLTFSTGLVRTGNTITDKLATGVSGGQSVIGGTASGNNLTLSSTTSGTKGKILFGTSGYDEVNNRLGIGTQSPTTPLTVTGNGSFGDSITTANAVRALNLNSTNASMRILRVSASVDTAAPSVELLHRTSADGTTDSYWDFFPNSTGFNIRQRTTSDQIFLNVAVNGDVSMGTGTFASSSPPLANFEVYQPIIVAAGNISTTASSAAVIGTNTQFTNTFKVGDTLSVGGENHVIASITDDTHLTTTTTWVISNTNASYNTSNYGPRLLVLGNGNTGINLGTGNILPSYSLQVGNNAISGIVSRFQNSTGTCDINPTGTALSCSSDMTLKTNINNLANNSTWSFNNNITVANQNILDKVLALNPVSYNWKTEDPGSAKHTGFIAQEVQQVFPDLVSEDATSHLLSLNYIGLIPYTIEAIKEINVNITSIDDLTKTNSWRDALNNWFADTSNGIKNFFSDTIKTNNLCVGSVCVTQQQFLQMVQSSGVIPTNDIPPSSSVSGGDSSTGGQAGDQGQSQSPEVVPPTLSNSSQSPEVTPVIPTDSTQ